MEFQFFLFYRSFNWLLIVVLTVNVNYIRCDNSTIRPNNANNSSCTLRNVTDVVTKSSCGDNEILFLFIKDSHIHKFPHVFEYFPKLQSVDISGAGIDHIDTTTFETATQLTSLDMNGSNMPTLYSHLFSHASNLTSFNMASSNISIIERNAFQGLANLKRLDLSNNKIVQLDAELFQPLSRLDTIRLTNNKVQVIDPDVFKHNANLKWVYFSSNDIIIVDRDSFVHCQLILLDLGVNKLQDVDMTSMKYLKTLIVANNRLTTLSIPSTVDELHAENNSISVIQSETKNELTRLFLSSNRFTNLRALTNLNKLQFLDLSNNHLRQIEFSDLKTLSELKEFKLTGNKLSTIRTDDVVTNLPKLKMIELSTKHWDNSYVDQLANDLKNHSIVLGQDRSIISDDDDITTSTTTIPSSIPSIPTRTPNDDNVERRLNDIDRRLDDVVSRMVDGKKMDDRFADMRRDFDDKLTKSNAVSKARFDSMMSTFKAYEALLITIFVACLMVLLYKVISYSKALLSGMRYRRTQSHDPIFSEQDL